jgi:Mitochondrial carrier protein
MSRTRLLQCRLRALYAGMSGPLFTVGLVQSINFGTYDTTRRILYYGSAWNNNDHANNNNKTDDYLHNDSLRNVAISSMTAGAVLACFTSPMMIIKTKQQLQGMSFRQAAREVLLGTTATTTAAASSSSSSIFQRTGMYTGFAPHFACETIGRGIYMCTYEALKRHLAARQSGDDDDDKEEAEGSSNRKISLSIRMVSAACAGIAGNAVVYPMDVIRCRFYAQTNVPVEQRSKNMRQLIQTIYHQERRGGSMRGFYRGFGVTLLRAGPVAAAVLPIYDITLETLNDGQYCIF